MEQMTFNSTSYWGTITSKTFAC